MVSGLYSAPLLASALSYGGGGALIAIVVIALVLLAPLFVVIGGLALLLRASRSTLDLDSFQNFATHVNLIEGVVQLGEKKEMVAIPFFMIAGAIMSQGLSRASWTSRTRASVGAPGASR